LNDMRRLIGLDIGEKRIGVAVSDPLNITAQSIGRIDRKNIESDIRKIKEIINEYGAEKIIVGLPLNMNGTRGKSAEAAEGFAAALKKEISAGVEMYDERLTTMQGERMLIEADVSRKKRRQNIDKISAQLILQNYMERNAQGHSPQ